MIINNTLIVKKLTQDVVLKALAKKITSIVYQYESGNLDIPEGIRLIRSLDYRIPAGWWVRNIYKKEIDKLPEYWNSSNGFSFNNTYKKITFWSYQMLSQQAYAVKVNECDSESKLIKLIFNKSYLGSVVVILLKWAKNRGLKSKCIERKILQKQIVFVVKDFEDIELSLTLIKSIPENKRIIVLEPKHCISTNQLQAITSHEIKVTEAGLMKVKKHIPLPFLGSKISLNIQRNIYNQLKLLNTYVSFGKWLKVQNPKAIVFNAAENRPELHLVSEYLMKNNIRTYNTMNGIKAKTANNADVLFTKWFVWDKKMADILRDCEYPQDNMEIVGHLAKDYALAHTFKDTLHFDETYYKHKKVVSFFSINTEIDEKKDVYQLLNSLKEEYHVLVREHPAYVNKDEKYYGQFTCNYELVDTTMSKQSLYDMLLVSDLVIVLGSTVALEATWFKVPVLTVEYKQESILYCADDDEIKHIKSKKELVEQFKKLPLKLVQQEKSEKSESVAALYKSALLN